MVNSFSKLGKIDKFQETYYIYYHYLFLEVESRSSNSTQTSMISFTDKEMSFNEKNSIDKQILLALISTNVPFSFVENLEVIKLFQMLRPSYQLPSRNWISTNMLDQLHDGVDGEIKKFISSSKYLTLSGDSWTSVSQQSILNFIITNENHKSQVYKIDDYSNHRHTGDFIFAEYKKVGMEIGLDKWVAFVSDSGPDFSKAKRLIQMASCYISLFSLIVNNNSIFIGFFRILKFVLKF
jgi:hypothetical protein